ncbi:hypothetical protein NM688_g2370 [Phlebia brevispora]|uniref:Uncharacterized protein n=1 Tax=Phlebia brevispora TaxID=194682 RepID=A0ACC1T9G3_9APHY|nr:hypothetical protein NM688_g2370 [Phlebia brevispora]
MLGNDAKLMNSHAVCSCRLPSSTGVNDSQLLSKDESISGGETDAWATIDQTVRDIDKGKVKDCTDDIDALLVFAGLYSAILTAFLIESYKALQEDPQHTMVQLLQQMTTQSYEFNGRFLNSTSPASSSDPFQAPTWAIRVNVCWFSSLFLSLSTASYGILVKQWLREYLSTDRTSHQERIRIRHFRHQGVEEWRLYDIAAVLPLILQISLALFFVGLCFFTAAVHPSIRTTSVVLVSAWAAFIVFAILAPLLSARCPFKTPLLKTVFSRLRPRLLGIMPFLMRYMASLWSDSNEGSTESASIPLQVPLKSPYSRDSADIAFLQDLSRRYVLTENASVREEKDIRNSDLSDLIIFRNVDTIFLDDDLLAMMREALRRKSPSCYEVFRFVVSIVQGRLDPLLQKANGQSASMSWPWALSYASRVSLIDMIANSLLADPAFEVYAAKWVAYQQADHWYCDAILLILKLSSPQDTMPKTATSLFTRLLQNDDMAYMLIDLIGSQFEDHDRGDDFDILLHTFASVMEALKACESFTSAWAFRRIIYRYFEATQHDYVDEDFDVETVLTSAALHVGADGLPPPENFLFVEAAAVLLHSFAIADNKSKYVAAFDKYTTALLQFVLKAIQIFSIDPKTPQIFGGIGLVKMLPTLFTTSGTVYPCLEFFATHHDSLTLEATRTFMLDPTESFSLSREAVISLLSTRETYFKTRVNVQTPINLVSALRLCNMVYDIPCTTGDREVNTHWHGMFRGIVNYIKKFYPSPAALRTCQHDGSPTSSHSDACQAVYTVLQRFEEDGDNGLEYYTGAIEHSSDPSEEDGAYGRWRDAFDITLSQVPDELIDLLRQVLCSEQTADYGCKFWRIRRLEEGEAGTGSPTHHPSPGNAGEVIELREDNPHTRSTSASPTTPPPPTTVLEVDGNAVSPSGSQGADSKEIETWLDGPRTVSPARTIDLDEVHGGIPETNAAQQSESNATAPGTREVHTATAQLKGQEEGRPGSSSSGSITRLAAATNAESERSGSTGIDIGGYSDAPDRDTNVAAGGPEAQVGESGGLLNVRDADADDLCRTDWHVFEESGRYGDAARPEGAITCMVDFAGLILISSLAGGFSALGGRCATTMYALAPLLVALCASIFAEGAQIPLVSPSDGVHSALHLDWNSEATTTTATETSALPYYVLKHAPLAYLYSGEEWWPSDVMTHIQHVIPKDGHTPVAESVTFANISTLGGNIFLASKDDPFEIPQAAWIRGDGPPDEEGYTIAPATIVAVRKPGGVVDAFYFYFYSYNHMDYLNIYGWGSRR